MNTLFEAIEKGSKSEAYRLLEEGADPNRCSEGGNTVLHEAVRNNHTFLAALLLSKGASFSVLNEERKRALSLKFTSLSTLHRIRQEYHRFPHAPYDTSKPACEKVRAYVDQLNRDGMIKITGLIKSEELKHLQSDFLTFVKKLRIGRFLGGKHYTHYDQVEYWRPKHRAYTTNDALRYSADLVNLCCNPVLTEIANYYLRKFAHIRRAYGMRYLPSVPINTNQFGWHHDMEDRQLKVMILLTDVMECDQYMTYVRGSHNAFHPYSRFLKNELDFDYCRTYLDSIEILKSTGQAGDLFLFDSNGMHRGNRSKGRIRDAFFVEFNVDKNRNNFWGSELSRNQVPKLAHATNHPLEKLLEVTPKWIRVENQKRRKRPTWVESLEKPDLWM